MAGAQKVVIIGAGVGGLATAALLAQAGYAVEVYEGRKQVGGRAGLEEVNDFRFDTGPSWYLMPEVYQQYFALLGERVEDHLQLTKLQPAYRVFYDYRQPLTIEGDIEHDTALFEQLEPGAGTAIREYLDQAERTYELAKRYFLYNPFTNWRTLLAPELLRHSRQLIRLLTQSLDAYVRSRLHQLALQQILEYPAVFLGTSPFSAPAMYHLMSYLDFKQGVYYPQGGIYEVVRVLQRMAEQRGVRVHTDSPVAGILTEQHRATGIRLMDGQEVPADVVISNADLHHTETELLPAADRSYPESFWQQRTAGPSALLIYLGVRGELPQLVHHNLLFVERWRENFAAIFESKQWPDRPSLYLCRPSATDSSVAPSGMENLFVLVPLPAGVYKSPDELEAYADHCLQLISEQCTIPDLPARVIYRKLYSAADFASDLHAWQGTALGMAHLLRQSAFFRPSNQSKKVPNLYYVGGDVQPGVGLPMCLIGAQLVYKRLHGISSAGPLDSISRLGDTD